MVQPQGRSEKMPEAIPPVGFRGVGLGTPAATASLPSQPKLRRAKLVATVLRVDGSINMAIIEALYRSATTGVSQDVKVIPSS
jgi:hypothetical protein